MTRVFAISSAVLKYHSQLFLAGAKCDFATNSPSLDRILKPWRGADAIGAQQFTMEIMVVEGPPAARPQPHFRGLHHIVVSSFGDYDVFVFDLLRRNVSGMVSRGTSRDSAFWNTTLLPITVGVMGAAVGVLPFHCACLSLEGKGVLLAGASGAGKSTLSLALAQTGLDFVSDDWTYISYRDRKLCGFGMSAPVKLMPDAATYFPALSTHPLRCSLNGELAYEVHACKDLGLSTVDCCEPRWVIFPERSSTAIRSELVVVPAAQTQSYLESNVEVLPSQLGEAALKRAALMTRLATLPNWIFRYHGSPQFAAQEFRRLFQRAIGAAA